VAGILEQPELERPEKSERAPKDNSVTLEKVISSGRLLSRGR